MRPGPFVAAKVVTAAGGAGAGDSGFLHDRSEARKSASSTTAPRQVVSREPGTASRSRIIPRGAAPGLRGGSRDRRKGLAGSASKERIRVPIERLKEGPITITVPLTGRLVVKLLDPVGNPFLQPTAVTVEGGDNRRNAVRFVVRTETGTAEFPFTPARGRLTLTASAESHDTVSGQAIESLSPGRGSHRRGEVSEEARRPRRARRRRVGLSARPVDAGRRSHQHLGRSAPAVVCAGRHRRRPECSSSGSTARPPGSSRCASSSSRSETVPTGSSGRAS